MRFIEDLSQETQSILQRIYKYSQHYRVRQRAHCILLSSKGSTTTQLQEIFHVDRITIYHWLNAWESRRLCGLYERKGRGRPPKLTTEHKEQIRQWAKDFPRNLHQIRLLIHEKFGIDVSKDTIKNILQCLQFGWHRIRRIPKGEPDPDEYQQKKEAWESLKKQEDAGEIDLRYFDASGFCLMPYMPYAWQEKGQLITVETDAHSKRLNVLGFLNRQNAWATYTFEGRIDSEVVIACIDDFCQTLCKKTVIVMDQASIHTSKEFTAKIAVWKEKNVEIFYLPPYSPELNIIEILWRFMKYEWIELWAYKSWANMVEYVENILKKFGIEYKINFS
jgi:transposase